MSEGIPRTFRDVNFLKDFKFMYNNFQHGFNKGLQGKFYTLPVLGF